ncbi:Ig-like domain-containing protein [Marinimicrococcus flavescens]|uniref:Ig-like domain-containing protein n=1 Tax=Marinimicrococcus flavescens TaxID=3031815 RepID=A0AAP4D4U1_9PROT|nr:Ig-like domain-containing protein [Marinimicrococcus flavescens]
MASISNPILDFITKRGSENRVIDLNGVFSGQNLTYTVESSDPSVAAVTIDGSELTIDFLETLGYSDLKITATDAAGNSVSDDVRVRVTGENAYTIAVLPDTQNYTNASRAYIFENMTNWLVDNKDSLNIEFVIHVGDITTNNSDAHHWPYAEQALRILDGEIPYSLLPGNHDQNTGNAANHSTDPLDTRFSPEKQAETNPDTFGGVYDQEPTRSANNYHTFTAPDGTKWLVLSLEFGPRDDVIRWAGEVIEEHLDHRVILANHSYMNWAGRHDATGAPLYGEGAGYDYGMGNSVHGANDGETMYRELIQKYSNVSFTFSGHIFGDGAETLVSYDQFGNPVYQMLVNYQNGISSEITSGGGIGSGSNGGNGAIRLLTIDPENNAVYTSTYFTELDDYLTGGRGDGELDRDGLTGEYRGHEETLDLYVGPPEVVAIAKAGNDQFVAAEPGQEKALVTLDGDWTINPTNDEGLVYQWTDRDGNVVSTDARPTLELGAGHHALTLTVTDSQGRVSTDDVLVVVSNDDTLLVDNFNDGDANGWSRPGPEITLTSGTPQEFEIAPLPGQAAPSTSDFAFVPKASATQGIKITPAFDMAAGTVLASYSIAFDILVPSAGAQNYTGLLQIDGGATSADAELFLKKSGETAGIGSMQKYDGSFTFDAWHRVVVTFAENPDGSLTLSKYIDGALAGTQVATNSGRYKLDPEKGFLLLADNDGETSDAYVSSVLVTDKVFTAQEVQELGGARDGGILATAPSANSVQFDFDADSSGPAFGAGTMAPQGGQEITYDSVEDFDVPAVPSAPTGGDADAPVMFIPKLAPSQGLQLAPDASAPSGTMVTSYTFIFDVMVPSATASGFTSLFQSDLANSSDAELFIRNNNNGTGGIGINSQYPGSFKYDQWQRVALTVEDLGNGSVRLSKYVDGVKVGTQTMGVDRYAIDVSKGVLLFTDENGETSGLYASSVLFTDKVYSDAEIAELGGVTAGGIVSTPPTELSAQINFGNPDLADDFGNAEVTPGQVGTGIGSFIVKGSAHLRDTVDEGQDALEGRVYEQSNSADNYLVWDDEGALSWSDYEFEATLQTTDNDGIGVVFYYQDDKNHYKIVLNAEANTRSLVKVVNGVESVLAQVNAGTPWSRDFHLKVAVVEGEINVFLDGHNVFGTVVDETPLVGGTVGFLSHHQKSSQFDNVAVNKVTLSAHAGDDVRALDIDGDGSVTVALSAQGSYGLADIVSYVWTNEQGEVVAEGKTAEVTLGTGNHALELTVTDANGKTATDTVRVDAVAKSKVLLAEDFGSAASLASWTIVDEGEFGGVGEDGTSSHWELQDGRLVQTSDLKSRQLIWNGASHNDHWQKGWSPLGDGANMLRKGTYALFNDPAAQEWSDYAVEATIQSPDNGALGLLFYYQDANNYYKLELDANLGQRHGSLFHLIQMKDGVEQFLAEFPAVYTPDNAFQLRVEVEDNQIQAYMDDMALFAYAIEDHAQSKGTVGLFSWDSAGVSFDNVTVVSLAGDDQPEPGDNTAPVAADDEGFTTRSGEGLLLAAALLIVNDSDADGDELTIVSVQDAVGGTATLDDAGNVLFTPAAGFVGEASFTYTVSDGKGGTSEATVTVTVDAAPNQAPVAGNDRFYALQDKPLSASLASLLANDRDEDGDTLTITSVQDAVSGTVELVDGKVVFTPEAGFAGEASFTYTVADGKGGEATGSVTVTVRPQPNRAPVAANDSVIIAAGVAATIAAATLLANDADADGDTLSITSVTAGTGGTVELDGENVIFTPADGFTGEASFTYTVSDGKGGTSEAAVTVMVEASNPYEGWTMGTAGDDVLRGEFFRANKIYGDAGDDVIRGGMRADELDGGDGDDEIHGGFGSDILKGGDGDDALHGGNGKDQLFGGEGDDELHGGNGDDLLEGGAGDDYLYGGNGKDRLIGGEGDDVLRGGNGRDTFVFAANSGADVIVDFQVRKDTIELVGLDFETFDDVLAAMIDSDDGVIIQLDQTGDNYILLEGVDKSRLSGNDFDII